MKQDAFGNRGMAERLPRRVWRHVPRLAFSLLGRLDGTVPEIRAFMRDHCLGHFETLERVRRERLSLARFGDGELWLADNADGGIVYQRGSIALRDELRGILRGDGDAGVPLLVCIPGMSSAYYRAFWPKYWRMAKPMLDPARLYGEAAVSRESLFELDVARGRAAWRAIWDGKDVCYVTGEGSRFAPVAALFDGVASERTILSTPKNAYADVPRLCDEIVATVSRETLVLLALGPAATVLAARLARLGYWALDIGHISSAYLTVVQGAPAAEKAPVVKAG